MIVLESVSKAYNNVLVLEDVNLTLEENRVIAILGPSGSGKTTLLRLIAGLEAVDAGRIFIDGRLASNAKIHLAPYQRKVGFVFQFPTLWPHLTVSQNITFGMNNHSEEESKRCAEMVERMELTSLLNRYPHQLSGGEARRVSLARTLISNPKYLLLDEPLTHLNPELRESLRQFILEFARQRGCGLVWVTHAAEEIKEWANPTYRIENGHLVAEEITP